MHHHFGGRKEVYIARWLQAEATRDQTHELIATTLEHALRTFGAPPKPNLRT